MKKSRYTETQIIKILKEVEGDRLIKEVCREYGISEATYYNWKSKFGGMGASDIKRLRELEVENRRLKQMLTDISLEQKIIKDLIKKTLKPAVRLANRLSMCAVCTNQYPSNLPRSWHQSICIPLSA